MEVILREDEVGFTTLSNQHSLQFREGSFWRTHVLLWGHRHRWF